MSFDQLRSLDYSTETGRLCPDCEQPVDSCSCKQADDVVPEGDGIVRLKRETKGRKGKGVTLIEGVPVTPAELKKLAKELKTRCGVGGAVKEHVIEIQGDQRDLLMTLLTDKGFKVKKAGG